MKTIDYFKIDFTGYSPNLTVKDSFYLGVGYRTLSSAKDKLAILYRTFETFPYSKWEEIYHCVSEKSDFFHEIFILKLRDGIVRKIDITITKNTFYLC